MLKLPLTTLVSLSQIAHVWVPPGSREQAGIPKFSWGPNPVTVLNLLRCDRISILLAPKYSHRHLFFRLWTKQKKILPVFTAQCWEYCSRKQVPDLILFSAWWRSNLFFPPLRSHVWITRCQVSEAGTCHLLVKTDMPLEQGQKATHKKELSWALASKKLSRERFRNSEHNPDYVI